MKNLKYPLRIFLAILSLMVLLLQGYAMPVKLVKSAVLFSAQSTFPEKRMPINNTAGSMHTNDAITSITNITICNNQLPYHWNGITCLNAGTFSVTLTGSSGADSIAVLNLSVINVGTSITNAIICNNQLPYTWNGNSYTTNGTYSVTLTSTSGCDSVPILSLTVNRVVTSTTSRTICSNLLPFSWNGSSYPSAGTYSVTLTSTAGCDSIATLILAVKPVTASTTNIAICNNRLPYFWNGNSYPAAGNYAVTLLNSNGCDSVASLHLTTKPTTSSTTRITVCTNQLPYNWNGNSYSTAGSYPVTLTGTSGCDSIASLILTIIPVVTTTTSITVCNGQLPYSWNGNSYPVAGIYSVTLTSSSGCDSIAKLRLTSVPFLTSTTNRIICNTLLPYSWNGNSYATGGTYTVSFITSVGCDSIATLNLTVETPHVSTDSIIVCNDQLPFTWHGNVYTASGTYPIIPAVIIDACHSIDTLVLAVQIIVPGTTVVTVCNNHLPYSWNGNNYSSTGIYGVTLTSSSGCDSLSNLNLTVVPVGTSTTNTTICNDQLPYSWNGNNYTLSGVYTARLSSANGCDSIATLNLVINPVMTSTTDLTICSTQLPFSWNGNSYASGGAYAITLMSSGGCDSIATLNLSVLAFLSSTTNITTCNSQLPFSWNGNAYPAAGIYTVTLTGSAGCDSVATLILTVNDVITSNTTLNICSTQLPYSWNGNTYTAAGTYAVTLLTTGGCDSVATLNLVVNTTVTSTTDFAICNNQLPFSWNGNSYPGAGVYPVTLTGTSGCDSIAILNLVVTNILTSTTNVTVCNAQLPYAWNGNSYPAGGTFSVILTTPGGCDSVPILSLTIVPYVTSTTDLTICNNQLPFTWNNNSYTAAGTYAVLLSGTSVCDSLATLNLAVSATLTSTTTITVCENILPFSWNGNTYPAAGTYSVTLTGTGGCDSIATLVLVVNAIATSITDVTICNSQLPYTWNGNSYTTAGTFSVTLTGSSGCDSVATLNLFLHPLLSSTAFITICNNLLPYTWNGNSYSAAGTYSLTFTGSSGCDSIATLQLIVHPITSSTTNASTCSNQLPYTWNGQDFTIGGTHVVTLINAAGCDSMATLHLTVTPVVASNSNASTCTNQLPYIWNGQSYTTAGLHTVTLVSQAGCDSVATLNLVINAVVSSITNAATCTNQLPYTWNGQVYNSTGNYTVILTATNGCDSVATLRLRVNPVTTSVTNAATCSGQLPYTWNGQNYTTAGPHIVTLTGSAGCDSVATLDLTINLTPSLPAVTSPVVYCQHEITSALNATLTTAGSHLLWYTTPAGGTGSVTSPVPSSATAGSTNYYVSQVNGPCEGPRVMITVTVNGKPVLGPDKAIKICYGQSADLSLLFNTAGFTVNWSLGQLTVADPSAVLVAGTYQVIVQSNSGCKDTALVNLSIQPPVIANAGNDDNAEYNIPYHLSGSGGGLYQWSPAGVLNNPFIHNPVAVLTHDETFVLMVTDDIGCIDLDTVKLRVLNGPTFYVPTAFTPNGDGLNDIFRPTYVGIAILDFFRVFNRYGELVFETHDIGKGWDGIYKGIKQDTNNFVWMIKATDRTGKLKTMKGNVVLIR